MNFRVAFLFLQTVFFSIRILSRKTFSSSQCPCPMFWYHHGIFGHFNLLPRRNCLDSEQISSGKSDRNCKYICTCSLRVLTMFNIAGVGDMLDWGKRDNRGGIKFRCPSQFLSIKSFIYKWWYVPPLYNISHREGKYQNFIFKEFIDRDSGA